MLEKSEKKLRILSTIFLGILFCSMIWTFIGYIFVFKLKIQSFLLGLAWLPIFSLVVLAMFSIFPLSAVSFFIWALIGWKRKKYHWKTLVLASSNVVGIIVFVSLFMVFIYTIRADILSNLTSQQLSDLFKYTDNLVGKPFPFVTLTDINGNKVDLITFKGKPLMLIFFATYNGWSLDVDYARKFGEKYQKQGLITIFINEDSNISRLRSFLLRKKITFPCLLDSEENILRSLYYSKGNEVILLINQNSIIVGQYVIPIWSAERDSQMLENGLQSLTK